MATPRPPQANGTRHSRLPASWDDSAFPRTSSPAPPTRSAPIRHSHLRTWLLHIVESEVSWLAWLQRTFRNPFLDVVMTRSSFLGSHTFFMIFLPVYFFGDFSPLDGTPEQVEARRVLGERLAFFGRTMVFLLSQGVYLTGVVKDHFMLPRPPSPPLTRLSAHQLAEEAAHAHKPVASIDTTVHLEYGFPSTHSANAFAMSVVTGIFVQTYFTSFVSRTTIDIIWIAMLAQYLLVAFSRLYCGMHAAIDVIGGTLIGILMVVSWLYLGGHPVFETFLALDQKWIVAASLPILFGIAPLYVFPLQSTCPCFDDAVCFAFVVAGICQGSILSGTVGFPRALPANFDPSIGMSIIEVVARYSLRMVVGLAMIILWRQVAKTLGHKVFTTMLGRNLGEVRGKTTPEQITRSFVYTGIGFIATYVAPLVFNALRL